MNKQEIIEEFRATVLRKIEQDETTEQKIENVVIEKLNKLSEIFIQNGVNPQIIEEYTDGNLSMLKVQISKLCDTRKDDIIGQVDFIIKKIQGSMEQEQQEEQEPEEERKKHQKNVDDMSLVETDNNIYASRIAGELADSIADIRSHTNRVLDFREIDMSTIESIIEDMRGYINRAEESSIEDINNILNEDRNNIIERLQSEYEKAIEEMKQIDSREEEQSEEKKFRKSLDAGISLEDQNRFVSKVQWAEVEEKDENAKDDRPKLGEDIELI